MILFKDCRHFKGNIPCVQNKKSLTWCNGCDIYDPITMNILIKLLNLLIMKVIFNENIGTVS